MSQETLEPHQDKQHHKAYVTALSATGARTM